MLLKTCWDRRSLSYSLAASIYSVNSCLVEIVGSKMSRLPHFEGYWRRSTLAPLAFVLFLVMTDCGFGFDMCLTLSAALGTFRLIAIDGVCVES
jgi:hypothetical protein